MKISNQLISFKSNGNNPQFTPKEYVESNVYKLQNEITQDTFISNAQKNCLNGALVELLQFNTVKNLLKTATKSYQQKLLEKEEQLKTAQKELYYFKTNKKKLILKEFCNCVDERLELIKQNFYRYNDKYRG